MRSILFTGAVLLLCEGGAWADEKDAKPGTGGPPPGKGWRKDETPAPTPKSPGKAVTPPAKEPGKPPTAKSPTPKPDDGIGATVSKWAKAGIHGRALAAKIHQLQATKAKTPKPTQPPETKPEKKGKPEVTPTPKGKKDKKGDEGEDN